MTGRYRTAAVLPWLLLLVVAVGLVWLALTYDGLVGAADTSSFAAFTIPLAAMARGRPRRG